jgi:TetR/AcrR family transcriptional regulator, transcriptional repressor for nem operon
MSFIIYIVKRFVAPGTEFMKVTREKAAENRDRIIETAARLFREKGFDGVGVAELMKHAGLTHGGFYGHFASKSDLAAQACARALDQSAQRWTAVSEMAGDAAFAALVKNYLGTAHRDGLGASCVISALGPEAPRQEPPVRQAITEGLEALLAVLTKAMPGQSEEGQRKQALVAMAQLVGAVVLARLVDDAASSDEILEATRADLNAPERFAAPEE